MVNNCTTSSAEMPRAAAYCTIFKIPKSFMFLRKIRTMKPGDEIPQPVHEHVLKQGKILQIEYITNLWDL